MSGDSILPPHGGYKGLKAYRNAEVVYDAATAFYDGSAARASRMF
jgi:hypothetical protein